MPERKTGFLNLLKQKKFLLPHYIKKQRECLAYRIFVVNLQAKIFPQPKPTYPMTNKLIATIALCLSGLNATAQTTPTGHMTQPLDPQLWEKSEWISVVNAPIARGRMNDGARAAD